MPNYLVKEVPLEPTDEMVQAAYHIDLSYMPGQEGPDRAAVYRAMVAAAPYESPDWKTPIHDLITHIDDILEDESFDLIDTRKWNAVTSLLATEATAATVESVLRACIAYVVHGDADFSGLPVALVNYFREKVDSLRTPTPIEPVKMNSSSKGYPGDRLI